MIEVHTKTLKVLDLRAIDDWIGEMVVNARPTSPVPFKIMDGWTHDRDVILITFLYPEDELAFKLKFQL